MTMTKYCYKCGLVIKEGRGTYSHTILQRASSGTTRDGERIFYNAPIVYLHIQCDIKLFGECDGATQQEEGMNSG